ncbi:DUF2496 domain-containing protein [Marinomonas pollencensis]|uniref:Uncharacterized protein DUF2496 n=1 Tax=Marinomonas pollencensis TaxID=491954 RepID=A0A3E0DHZ1_9GAMM|nr:DUF2496 domain-containing protein [Marinomonas pollencensis]REG82225.1 uncharacterized protein DUF2496 [Marinomonas pollencensis]
MSLENAPAHIKLAIDLIALLEDNQIDNQVAIDALTLALKDFEAKKQKLAAN